MKSDPNHMGVVRYKVFWGIPTQILRFTLNHQKRVYNTIQSSSISTVNEAETALTAKWLQAPLSPDNKTDLNTECRKNTAGAEGSSAVGGFSVCLSWKGAPLISVLPAFALQEGWPPVYGPPSPPLPGPSSHCRRKTRNK